jgi:hypothetical protein
VGRWVGYANFCSCIITKAAATFSPGADGCGTCVCVRVHACVACVREPGAENVLRTCFSNAGTTGGASVMRLRLRLRL